MPSRGREGGFGQLCDVAALPMQQCEVLATCHGLARLGEGAGGELVGDPLDQRLWEATGWTMLDQPVGTDMEVVAVPLEDDPSGMELHVTPTSTPRAPGVPGMLTTAHVHTRVKPPAGGGAYTVLKRFEFSSEKQRNSVVVQRPDGTLFVASKGSPEAIHKLAGESAEGRGVSVEGVMLLASTLPAE